MPEPPQIFQKIDMKYYNLLLLLVPSLIYLSLLILAIKFTNSLGTLLVTNVLFLVIFENIIPLIESKIDFESRVGSAAFEDVTEWVRQAKQKVVFIFSVIIVLIGMGIDLSNTILQWNWKYTSVVWLVYFTFAFPISALLPPREEGG